MADYMLDPPDDDDYDDNPCSLCDGSCYDDDEPDYPDDEASDNASSDWENSRDFS